jgi:hypothetical protein
MVMSLLAYFFSMMTALAVVVTLWIGLISASPFQWVHLQSSYPLPPFVEADSAPAVVAPAKKEDNAQTRIAAQSGASVADCEARFRSYNPASGTFTGYDGLQHPCP